MNTPPPLFRDQRAVDRQHLTLLAVFHFVVSGLALLGIGFVALHYLFLKTFLDNPEMWKNTPNPPPAGFFAIFKWFCVIASIFLILATVGNLLSALYLQRRKNRTFSLIVAGLDCLQIPFGTVLGVFTILVLVRESVVELYEPAPQPPGPTI